MKKEPIRAVLFDLDGTLLYTLEDIKAAINIPLANRSLPLISIEECREIVGHGLRNAVIDSFALKGFEASEEKIEKALAELQGYYKENPTKYCKPYEKITSFLTNLDVPFGLLSNKDDKIVKQIVEEVFKNINFKFICGAKDGVLKPNKTRVLEFCEKLSLSPSQVLYVGDSEVDYKTAVNSKSQVALVTWGYRDKKDLIKFNAPLVDSVEELGRLINGN